MAELSSYVVSDLLSLSARELLQSSPGALLGVTSDGVDILKGLQIHTVFDLATSRLFANAELLVEAGSDSTNYLVRFGSIPFDVIDASAAGIPISELQFSSTEILRGISVARAKELETEVSIKTVRDLAKWPPYIAAKSILRSEYFPEAVPGFDPEAPEDLLPKSGEYPTERVFAKCY